MKDHVDDDGDYGSDNDDTVYCHLNCRQCKPLSASVQGLKTTLTHSDYLGTHNKPIVPENYKDLDVFDLRYRQKASASEVTADLVIAMPPNVLDNPETFERGDASSNSKDKTQLLRVEVEYELSDYLFGLHRGHFCPTPVMLQISMELGNRSMSSHLTSRFLPGQFVAVVLVHERGYHALTIYATDQPTIFPSTLSIVWYQYALVNWYRKHEHFFHLTLWLNTSYPLQMEAITR